MSDPSDPADAALWRIVGVEIRVSHNWDVLGRGVTAMIRDALHDAKQAGELFVLTADEIEQLLQGKQ